MTDGHPHLELTRHLLITRTAAVVENADDQERKRI